MFNEGKIVSLKRLKEMLQEILNILLKIRI